VSVIAAVGGNRIRGQGSNRNDSDRLHKRRRPCQSWTRRQYQPARRERDRGQLVRW
jgi:hypothetical protein